MLPKNFRESLFEKMSVKTMRFVSAVPTESATGLVRATYDMIAEDFFINGSLTSHSKVPDLLSGAWVGGREVILVTDQLDRTTKEAMGATLSYLNDCPYCADMLVSLVHGGGNHRAATQILKRSEDSIDDPVLRERLTWITDVATSGGKRIKRSPFSHKELPEAIGTLFTLNYVNRFSHVVMDGSPVGTTLKNTALRLFGHELSETTERVLEPGRSLSLLPSAHLPEDFKWAGPNPRIANTLARWAAAVDRESSKALSPQVREVVERSLHSWQGEQMPLSRSWVENELTGLHSSDRSVARLMLVVAKASYQVDELLVLDALGKECSEQRLIRLLSFASFSAARRLASKLASDLGVAMGKPLTLETRRPDARPVRSAEAFAALG